MNSIGTRLFAAFLAIILLVLLVVSFALIVLLRNNPIVERQQLTRLNEVASLVVRQQWLTPGMGPAEARARVEEIAETYQVRALVAGPGGQVLLDSAAGELPPLELGRFRAARRDPAFPLSLVGRASDQDRNAWLYVARGGEGDLRLVLAAPLERFSALAFFRENLLTPLLQAAGLAALVAGLLAMLISRSIAQPLQQMSAAAQGIARGDYAQPAPVSGPDEVRALGAAFNRMGQQVQATQQAQRDFLANVSHELKTPLTSIQGFAQAMLDGAVSAPEQVQRSASIIYSEADRMRRLVEGLLDLARLDAGLRTLNRAPLDLRAVLTSVVEKFGPAAQAKGLALSAELPAELPPLLGDGDRLAQVFTNLLDNALKYTPVGGRASVTARPLDGGVEVVIADTGSGIPPEDLDRIFERFYQVDKSRARSGGVGLGLAISKEIVEAHGGRLHAESPPGAGARFVVRLPAVRPTETTFVRQQRGS